jgi:mono/diheme cytochrome c family protein
VKNLKLRSTVLAMLAASAALLLAADKSWLQKVPSADRARVNPYAGGSEAVSAGRNLFVENCAHCHGENAEGLYGRPSLRSERVARATDGELAWLLRNGSLRKGMPSWITLPEPERWQIIAYLRGLSPDASAAAPAPHP